MYKRQFQYTAAIALLDGAVGSGSFTDEKRFRQDVVDLLGKTTLTRDPSIPRDTRIMRVEIEAEMSDGTRHRHVCTRPPGAWGAPIDPAMHRAKLRDCLGVRLKEREVDSVLDLLANFERASARDVGKLIGLLA